jgi:8-oxo-dGTP pyrophosphatase MutT (NUDIX family)
VSDQTAGAPVVPAATILLLRDAPAFEVLMVKRHHQIDFAAGALVFPGGKTHASDHAPGWAVRALGWDETPAEQRALRIAAIREAYEETGILLARHADGVHFRGDERAGSLRPSVVAEADGFLRLFEDMDLALDLAALTPFARWITPAMMPKRFDTWFFLAAAPPDQLAQCDGWETVDAEWIEPDRALALAAAGERSVIFPTRMNLQLLAESADADEARRRAGRRTLVTVEPKMIDGPDGRFLVIPSDAGYGEVSVPAASLP